MLTWKRSHKWDNPFTQLILPNELTLWRWVEHFQCEVCFLWSFVPIKVMQESWWKWTWMCLKWICFDIWLFRNKKCDLYFSTRSASMLSWCFLFFNNSSKDNKAPRHQLPFEFAAEKIPCLKYLETEFYLITCIFEVDNYFPEYLDGCFSNSSLKILFWLWETLAEKRGLFPPKRCYNDTSHLGGFLYRSMFYSSNHQALNWFCLIVTFFIQHRLGSPTATGF